MAAAKAENLTLVVHGPGDLRLVKREGEREAWPDPAPLASEGAPPRPRRLQLATGPAPPGPGRPDLSWSPWRGEGAAGCKVLRGRFLPAPPGIQPRGRHVARGQEGCKLIEAFSLLCQLQIRSLASFVALFKRDTRRLPDVGHALNSGKTVQGRKEGQRDV